MKVKQKGLALIIPLSFIAIAAAVGLAAQYFYNKDDSPLEEEMEEYIEGQTGHNIDFTPATPESKEMNDA